METSSKLVPQDPACPRRPKNKKKDVRFQEGIRNPFTTAPQHLQANASEKPVVLEGSADGEVAGWSRKRCGD